MLFNSRSGNYPGYVTLKPIDRNSFEKGQNIKVYGKISSPFLKPLVKSNWKLWKVNTGELGNPYYITKESDQPKNIIVVK